MAGCCPPIAIDRGITLTPITHYLVQTTNGGQYGPYDTEEEAISKKRELRAEGKPSNIYPTYTYEEK